MKEKNEKEPKSNRKQHNNKKSGIEVLADIALGSYLRPKKKDEEKKKK